MIVKWVALAVVATVLLSLGPRPTTAAGQMPVVSAGNLHTCAVTTAGGIKCWGWNSEGQLGDATPASPRANPVDVAGLSSGVANVASGWHHTCAVTMAGGVKCWGADVNSLLGSATTERCLGYLPCSTTPLDVNGLTGDTIAVTAGLYHTCALAKAGGVKCWGSNAEGEIGDGSTTNRAEPVDVSGLTSGVSVISAGMFHTCAVTTAGAVECWGDDWEGQLGDTAACGISCSTPVNVPGLSSGVDALAAGYTHTCALTTAGGVKCWGSNGSGELGDGQGCGMICTPVDVAGLTSGVVAIAAGAFETCAVTATGGLKCWGRDDYGKLGAATSETCGGFPPECSTTPVDVTGLSRGVTAVTVGGSHACAVMAIGAIKCWGRNYEGQLGDGQACGNTCPEPVTVLGSETAAPGDANCDQITNSVDASLVLQFVAGLVNSLPCQDAADLNQDGTLTAVDATLILQGDAGLSRP